MRVPPAMTLRRRGEAGFRRASSGSERAIWFRAGYLHNSTRYLNFANGRHEPGNHAAFALMDVQLTRSTVEHPERGLYIGASAMTAASHFNAFDRYYEARLYKFAPFASRPRDVASLVSTYTGFSKSLTDSLVANEIPRVAKQRITDCQLQLPSRSRELFERGT